jgi:hypothetical protein
MVCSRCGNESISLSPHEACSLCGGMASDQDEKPFETSIAGHLVPWESHTTALPPLQALVQTIIRSFTQTKRFFPAATRGKSISRALIYGLLTGTIGVLATALWEFISPFSMASIIENSDLFSSDTKATTSGTLIATPFVLIAQILFLTLYCHTMLRMTGSRKQLLRTTFKTVCYAQGASLFQIIPFLGVFLSTIAAVYLLVTGIHATNDISRFKAFMILFLPLFILAVLLAVVAALIIAGLALYGMGGVDPFSFFKF